MTVIISVPQDKYEKFMYRDIESFSGFEKLTAAFTFNNRYKIVSKAYEWDYGYKYRLVKLTFATEEDATWFLLNFP